MSLKYFNNTYLLSGWGLLNTYFLWAKFCVSQGLTMKVENICMYIYHIYIYYIWYYMHLKILLFVFGFLSVGTGLWNCRAGPTVSLRMLSPHLGLGFRSTRWAVWKGWSQAGWNTQTQAATPQQWTQTPLVLVAFDFVTSISWRSQGLMSWT